MKDYVEYIMEQAQKLLAIDSPSGYTKNAAQYLCGVYQKLGYEPQITVKGGVLVKLCGTAGTGCADPSRGPILLMAHTDTLGAMVSGITPEGRLKLTPLGGLNPNNTEAENCRIVTRKGKVYTGTFQLANASIHVNGDYNEKKRSYDSMEVLVDEPVKSADDVKRLGIMTGDIVCFDPRTTVTPSGYLKSRFLDDKLSTAILLGYAAYLKEEGISPERTVYEHITVFEEVGHGACASVPEGVTELLSVVEGEDLVTLLTCTPYGVNTQRLLVRGHRVPYVPEEVAEEASDSLFGNSLHTNYIFWVVVGLALTGAFIGGLVLRDRYLQKHPERMRKRRRRRHAAKKTGRESDGGQGREP